MHSQGSGREPPFPGLGVLRNALELGAVVSYRTLWNVKTAGGNDGLGQIGAPLGGNS